MACKVPSCPGYLPSLSKVRHQGLLPLFSTLIALYLWIALDAVFPNPALLAFAANLIVPFTAFSSLLLSSLLLVRLTLRVLAEGLGSLGVSVTVDVALVDGIH